MTKTEQFRCIDNFLVDNLNREELRKLVFDLISDENLLRNFRLYTTLNGAFL